MNNTDLHTYLLGTWRLIEWRIEYSDNRTSHPFGTDALGQILYSSDGGMSATISANQRNSLAQTNSRHADNNALAQAFRSYFHYAGRWEINKDSVVHYVDFSLNPDFVNTTQTRKVTQLSDTKMILSAIEPLAEGSSRKHMIEWERANHDLC